MGQGNSNTLRENLESLHSKLMQQAGADYDIATSTTLSYEQFLSYITQLNSICREYKDREGHVLVFAVKKGTDSSIFWRTTVRVACVKLCTTTNKVQTYRLLTIRQFLQIFRRITYECTTGSLGNIDGIFCTDSAGARGEGEGRVAVPPTVAASLVLEEEAGTEQGPAGAGKGMEECVICLERVPDVTLPCAHSYCLPCIEQWWEYSDEPPPIDCSSASSLSDMHPMTVKDRTCPVCREALTSTDDTWVLSEAPDSHQVNEEIRRTLIGLAGTSQPHEPHTE